MKICKTCNATEDLIGFRKDRRICNDCLKKNKQEYYLSNHKETREHQNKYRELNRYKINAQKREHYKLNSERIRKQNAEYAKNNRDKRNINKNNRAILSQNGFAHAAGEWNQDSNRITIAYNCVPFDRLNPDIAKCGQYIPL